MSGLCSAYFEPYVCNSCPHNVRHCSALLSFKNKLKAFFFSHYFRSNYYLCSISMSYMCKWFEFIALNCTRRTLLYLYTDYCSSVNMYRMSVQGRRRALDKCTLFLLFERVINVHYYCYHWCSVSHDTTIDPSLKSQKTKSSCRCGRSYTHCACIRCATACTGVGNGCTRYLLTQLALERRNMQGSR